MFMLGGVRGGGRKIKGNYKMKHPDVTYLTEWDVKQRRGWRKRWQKGFSFANNCSTIKLSHGVDFFFAEERFAGQKSCLGSVNELQQVLVPRLIFENPKINELA